MIMEIESGRESKLMGDGFEDHSLDLPFFLPRVLPSPPERALIDRR